MSALDVPQADTVGPHATGNPGVPFDADWLRDVRVNTSATERRAATLTTRRTVKKEWQVAWLLKAITTIDLTTLAGDDTPGRVRRLCAKAKAPLRRDLIEALGIGELPVTVGAVCVYPTMVATAVDALAETGIPVASVASGFPSGLMPMPLRIAETQWAVQQGAREIDVVITREHALLGRWQALYDEVRAFKEAAHPAHLKVILAVGELGTQRTIAKAAWVAMMAGADFVKTSTGKESVNATLENSLTMVRAVRAYQDRTGFTVGFKPAGGIRTAKQALAWLILMREELGPAGTDPSVFRIGASGLLTDVERQLDHAAHGRYAAMHHQPLP